MKDSDLDRLLRAASASKQEPPAEAPLGFDTRVVALWRAEGNGRARRLALLVRRVAFAGLAVILVAGAGAYREINQSRDMNELFADDYAIADSAIQQEFGP